MTMVESEFKISKAETAENKSEKKKKRFFSGLRNRLLALAAAGFITLGAGWGKDLLRQLKVEEADAVVELVAGSEITENALNGFKDRIEKEEPGFAKLAEEYEEVIKAQLKDLESAIAQDDINSPGHWEQDRQSMLAAQHDYKSGIYRQGNVYQDIDIDHKLISQLVLDPAFLEDSHEFINANLDDIFWGMALLNDSKALREAIKFIKPPTVTFKNHSPYSAPRRADTIPFWSSAHWQPEITLYPQVFMGLDQKISSNTYLNVFIHELGHAFLAGSSSGRKIDRKIGNDFADVLDEGRIQSVTYKIVRYLNRDNPNFKPIIGEAGEYDQNLVIAEIIEGISRIHPNSDFLVEWQMGIIDHKTMLDSLRTTLNDLGLDEDIPKLLADFNFGADRVKSATQLLSDLIAKLKLGNINLSDEFVRSILIREREQKRSY